MKLPFDYSTFTLVRISSVKFWRTELNRTLHIISNETLNEIEMFAVLYINWCEVWDQRRTESHWISREYGVFCFALSPTSLVPLTLSMCLCLCCAPSQVCIKPFFSACIRLCVLFASIVNVWLFRLRKKKLLRACSRVLFEYKLSVTAYYI